MDKYADHVKNSNTITLRSLLNKMPVFCSEFFRGISNSTEIRTQVAYCRDIYHFLFYIKNHNPIYKNIEIKYLPFELLELLEPADIDEYLEYLSLYEIDGVTYSNDNAAKARKLSSISKLYDFYIKRKLLKNNPIIAVERPKVNEKAIIALNKSQIKDLINMVNNPVKMTPRQKKFHEITVSRDLAIMMLFLGSGIRVSELVGLNIDDLDLKEFSLRIIRKGGNETFVYFNEEVSSALFSYLGLSDINQDINDIKNSPRKLLLKENKNEPALFLSLRGSRLTVRSVEILVKKYSEMLGINKKITPHKLRSTYGTELYNKTGDIYLTAESLGHKDINTTKKHYASMDINKLKEAADVIDFDI